MNKTEEQSRRAVAIITARGGSKRIPRKNIRDFCGRPILSYSIRAALGSGAFDEVMVSTDDDEIVRREAVGSRCSLSALRVRFRGLRLHG